MDKAEEMLEYVRQCASMAAEVARRRGRKRDHVAYALATLYDGLLEIYEGEHGVEDQKVPDMR